MCTCAVSASPGLPLLYLVGLRFDIRELIQSEHYLECQSYNSERPSRMYIIPGVSEKTEFKPRVRKEIKVGGD